MRQPRLSILARRLAPKVNITEKEFTPQGWNLKLECGHTGSCVSHMNPGKDWSCGKCGEDVVRSHPIYSKEF